MKINHLSYLALILATLHVAAEDVNLDSAHSSLQPRHDWELVRSVPGSFGNTIDFVLIPKAKICDLTNYQAAAEAIAGTRDRCMINFWADRSQVPTSAWIPVTNLQVMTATYERSPHYERPHLHLACWLYPSVEAATSADAFFMPGVKMPKPETTTNRPSDMDRVVNTITNTLPPGWTIAEQKTNQIPWGHHWDENYTGPKGLLLIAKGTRPVNAEFCDTNGTWQAIHVATESLHIWLMPSNYSDSLFAWMSFERPIQPIVVVNHGPIKVYALPTHLILSEQQFDEILNKFKGVRWPDSPGENLNSLTWKDWHLKLREAIEKVFAK